MKKIIPLLVVAAGAVAYNVYKNRKESVTQEKTFVVIDDSNDTSGKPEPIEELKVEPTVLEESVIKEAEEIPVSEEVVIDPVIVEESTMKETLVEAEEADTENDVEVTESKLNPLTEVMQEVQEELGIFETLSDMDEPYGRPSFFHVTDDSYIESEIEPATEIVSTIVVEDDEEVEVEEQSVEEVTPNEEVVSESEVVEEQTEEEPAVDPVVVEEVQEEILSTIVVEDTEEELDVEIELILEEQLDIDEVVEFAQEVEETILATILVEDDEDEEPVEVDSFEDVSEITETEPAVESAEEPTETEEEPEVDALIEEIAEQIGESKEEPVLINLPEIDQEENDDSEETIVEFNEETAEEDEPIEVEALIEEIAEQIEESKAESVSVHFKEESEVELEPLKSYNTPEVDELMKTIAGQVKAADQVEEESVIEKEAPEEVVEELPQSEEGDYLQDIRKITELYSEKVAQYNIRFPYLSSRFIDDTLKFSNQFNTEYPIGTRVAIEHHMHFNAVEDLFVFAQIIRQTGYIVKEGAEDKTLIAVREMFVDNNTILHDVLKVANQVYCLSGEYQKFRITKR